MQSDVNSCSVIIKPANLEIVVGTMLSMILFVIHDRRADLGTGDDTSVHSGSGLVLWDGLTWLLIYDCLLLRLDLVPVAIGSLNHLRLLDVLDLLLEERLAIWTVSGNSTLCLGTLELSQSLLLNLLKLSQPLSPDGFDNANNRDDDCNAADDGDQDVNENDEGDRRTVIIVIDVIQFLHLGGHLVFSTQDLLKLITEFVVRSAFLFTLLERIDSHEECCHGS